MSAWQRETADVKMVNEKHPEGWYRIVLDGGVKIEAADEYGAYYAATTLENIKTNSAVVRNMTIEDYPDFDIRGFMLNVATVHKTMDEVASASHRRLRLAHRDSGDSRFDRSWCSQLDSAA